MPIPSALHDGLQFGIIRFPAKFLADLLRTRHQDRGIAQGWGSPSKVTSPTYVIVNEYPRPDGNTLFHCDAYRLQPENPLDSAILDLDRAFKVGALVVEWAERLKDTLPRENLWIQMDWINEDQRHLILVPHGRRYETVLKKLQQSLFGG